MTSRGWAGGTVLLWTQGRPLDGSWELTRIFRSGPSAGTRAVAIDSTVYIRLSLASHTGGWVTGALYRRYLGPTERTQPSGGPPRRAGGLRPGAGFYQPPCLHAETAASPVGGT